MIRPLRFRALFALLAAVALGACTDENPVAVDDVLLPGGQATTFEVVLDPEQWLDFDTAFSGYNTPFGSGFQLVAKNYGGVLEAHTLARYALPPSSITVDSSGTSKVDTLPRYPSGYIAIKIDTLRTRGAGTIAVYRTGEPFDIPSASWTSRIDSGAINRPWQQPGGTRGPLIGRVTWAPGIDSVTIPLDSATIASLSVATDSTRGVLFVLEDVVPANPDGALVRFLDTFMRLDARSRIRPDTVVKVLVDDVGSTLLYNPPPAAVSAQPRVSGTPAWRSIFQVNGLLERLEVPCPGTNCSVRLGDARLNKAELLLQPVASPPGFLVEDSIGIEVRTLVAAAGSPIARAPVGTPLGRTTTRIPRTRFEPNAPAGAPVPVAVTSFVNAFLTDTSTTKPRHFALLSDAVTQSGTFGIAAFQERPRLRLILTITPEQR
jgi:hypothetical protein